uniref:Uncharacterized protein n=1 Tax=Anguilla anguilla TaxID=7936 RepID=A0A0E9W5F0_ANGAN
MIKMKTFASQLKFWGTMAVEDDTKALPYNEKLKQAAQENLEMHLRTKQANYKRN